MKINKYLLIILLSACLSQFLAMSAIAIDAQPTNTNASTNTASKDDLSTQKELFQIQLDTKNKLLQKDIEAQSKRVDAFEKQTTDFDIHPIGPDKRFRELVERIWAEYQQPVS